MKIEIFGPFNPDGSTMPLTEYEIEDGCERVLYAPHQPLSYGRGPLWGFKDGRQVYATVVYHEDRCCITG